MNVVQVLLKVLRLLLVLQVILRDRVLQLLVRIFHLIQLHLELEYLLDAVQQVLVQLLALRIERFGLGVFRLLDLGLHNLTDIWLLFRQLLVQSQLQFGHLGCAFLGLVLLLSDLLEHFVVTLKHLLNLWRRQ